MKRILSIVIACVLLTSLVGCGKDSTTSSNVVYDESQTESSLKTEVQSESERVSETTPDEIVSLVDADSIYAEQSIKETNDDEMAEVVFPPEIAKNLGIPTSNLDDFCADAGFESAEMLDDGSISIRMTEERRHMLLSNCSTSAVMGAAQIIINNGQYGLLNATFDYDTQSLAMYVDYAAYESDGVSALMLRAIPEQAIKTAAAVEGDLCWNVTVYDNDSKNVIDEYSVESAG